MGIHITMDSDNIFIKIILIMILMEYKICYRKKINKNWKKNFFLKVKNENFKLFTFIKE